MHDTSDSHRVRFALLQTYSWVGRACCARSAFAGDKAARRPVEKTLLRPLPTRRTVSKSRDALFIKEIRIDEGPDYRRWRPRAFGRAAPIPPHSCHIYLALEERPGTTSKQVSAPKTAETHESAPADEKVSSAITEGIPLTSTLRLISLSSRRRMLLTRHGRTPRNSAECKREREKEIKRIYKNIIQRKPVKRKRNMVTKYIQEVRTAVLFGWDSKWFAVKGTFRENLKKTFR